MRWATDLAGLRGGRRRGGRPKSGAPPPRRQASPAPLAPPRGPRHGSRSRPAESSSRVVERRPRGCASRTGAVRSVEWSRDRGPRRAVRKRRPTTAHGGRGGSSRRGRRDEGRGCRGAEAAREGCAPGGPGTGRAARRPPSSGEAERAAGPARLAAVVSPATARAARPCAAGARPPVVPPFRRRRMRRVRRSMGRTVQCTPRGCSRTRS
jgi:hypothetical protein